ncbi:uncharacterized protein MONOS_16289 [Monocercomonoides exilis]|uniref:uncharacterized protein n=1 Tax=Monocercomonoides exilis TaxID=2049356 RepID=UPI0035595B2D|nr:hypothetical protein MONOS_16289 [Monocercomonoides exilis]|eukprot:MONOS_16289.1-p1 / transcript=MONOS_16289.1 / gene=MONOS_16289 / organism=Monocercomonoides_exilis_PA203 / gene_product=unspecified product / transcript_product=unspecified product / location=Mono_scaffold01618:3024-3497(-) / protein_length=158 / sequence_SO=supercontig / SO=protein_coding / is_pseudo=false
MPKKKMMMNENNKITTSHKDTFETRLEQAATKRSGRGREEKGGADHDEQQQLFCSFDSTLSSSQLHTQNIKASSTIATTPFSHLPCTQLSVTYVLAGAPLPPATDTSSLTQKSFCTTGQSSTSSSPSSISSFSLPIPLEILGKNKLCNANVFARRSV